MDGNTFASRVFALVSLGLIGLGAFLLIEPFIGPVLWASLLALLLFPANAALTRRLGNRKGLAALLLTIAVILVVVIPTIVLAGAFVAQAGDLMRWLQASASQYHIAKPSDLLAIPAVRDVVNWMGERVPVTTEQMQAAAVQAGQSLIQTLLGVGTSVFAGALGATVSVILALFLFFFFVRDGEEIARRAIALVPLDERRKSQLVEQLAAVVRGVVLGSLATAIVQGALVGIAFAIAGLPSPVVFAVLAMLAALIPLVGAAIVWLPATLILALQGSWGHAIFMLAWSVVVVSSADNVIRPLFVSSRAKISTLPVFIGLFGGVSAFGAVGMFVGPVLVALVLALFGFAEEAREERLRADAAHAADAAAPAPPPGVAV